MTINYFIIKTKLNGNTRFVGRASIKGSCDRDMVISRMIESGTTVGKEDILGVISLFEKTVYNMCLEGNKVTLDGFMQFTPTIGGTFDGEVGGFDKSKNEVYITAQVSSAYNKSFSNDASVEKIIATDKRPYLLEVVDNETGEANLSITKNNIVTLYGEQMKFDSSAADEYLRFVNAGNPADFTPISKCQKITEKEIVFLMPAVTYANGYFELGAKRGTTSVRVGKSPAVEVK